MPRERHPYRNFSLHAEVRLAINQPHKLEHLCRYITRAAIANDRLQRHRDGQVVLQLKSPYQDGTTHIVMEPLEFMQRLAALVPRPRLHLIRFHGVLAPNAKLRPAIIPSAPIHANDTLADHGDAPPPSALARMRWAQLLKRVFDIDIEHCPHCGGLLTIIAAIVDPTVIARSSPISACPSALRPAHPRVDPICATPPNPASTALLPHRAKLPFGLHAYLAGITAR